MCIGVDRVCLPRAAGPRCVFVCVRLGDVSVSSAQRLHHHPCRPASVSAWHLAARQGDAGPSKCAASSFVKVCLANRKTDFPPPGLQGESVKEKPSCEFRVWSDSVCCAELTVLLIGQREQVRTPVICCHYWNYAAELESFWT